MKRLTLLLFSLLFSVLMLAGTYSGGSGTSGDPYQIATTSDLIELSNTSSDWNYYFIQTANISFNVDETLVDWDGDGSATWDTEDQKGFSPIGNSSTYFDGTYDGQNYSIDNLYINRSANDNIGLFGYVSDGTISNLKVSNADITGNEFTGVLCGQVVVSSSSIDNCETSGSLSATAQCGGMIGGGDCEITNSNSSVTVTAGKIDDWSDAGGLIGDAEGTITNCYATGDVTTEGRNAGGLVGWVQGDLIIVQSYATGNVTINSSSSSGEAGGLVGSYSGN
ncbi:MAG: hypothetical protein K9I29_06620 [Bacteroidales bacterium]|nr:hypothetical protein [Bacteroidales bacterium]MCF8327953.1 hypothetical protein [Bacteroidales bacterium]